MAGPGHQHPWDDGGAVKRTLWSCAVGQKWLMQRWEDPRRPRDEVSRPSLVKPALALLPKRSPALQGQAAHQGSHLSRARIAHNLPPHLPRRLRWAQRRRYLPRQLGREGGGWPQGCPGDAQCWSKEVPAMLGRQREVVSGWCGQCLKKAALAPPPPQRPTFSSGENCHSPPALCLQTIETQTRKYTKQRSVCVHFSAIRSWEGGNQCAVSMKRDRNVCACVLGLKTREN